jgi:hypothetical protein
VKPRTLAALDRAMDFPLAVAAGFALGLAGAFLAAIPAPDPSPAVSTRESAFRFAGWGEAAGDSFTAPQEPDQTMNADEITTDFLDALARLESGNQPTAVNRREDAHGLYQIRPSYLADANRIMGTNYTLADCHRPAIAEEIVRAYLGHYGDAYAKRTGKPVTREVLARIHNGGPRGAEREATADYGARFVALWEASRHA